MHFITLCVIAIEKFLLIHVVLPQGVYPECKFKLGCATPNVEIRHSKIKIDICCAAKAIFTWLAPRCGINAPKRRCTPLNSSL